MLAAVAKRFAIILIAYGAACLVAGFAIRSLTALLAFWLAQPIDEYKAAAESPVEESLLVAIMTAIFMAIPTLLTLPFLEAGEVRNPLAYGLIGGVWGAFMFLLVWSSAHPLIYVFTLSGVIAGLVYWAVAGRQAGQVWR
jgi:hypothetical protein